MVRQSATLAIDARIRALRAGGRQVLHLGFGEAGLPVLPEVADVLAAAARRSGSNSYGKVAGSESARAAAAGYFTRRGLPTDPDQIIYAPGSKALLFALLAAIPGDVVLPRPSWVSYAAQASLAGKAVISVPIAAEAGGVPDPSALDSALSAAAAAGRTPGALVLTTPDNPTGTIAGAALMRAVVEVAERHGLWIVSDEIYRDLAYEPRSVTSPSGLLPSRTVVTTGLSKAMALGGWRIGLARLPVGASALREELIGIGSEVWSSLAVPMQQVAEHVLAEPPTITTHVAASRRLHASVARAVYDSFLAAGASCRPPRGAFYLYPDLESFRSGLPHQVTQDASMFTDYLLDHYGIGVLTGAAFGDDPSALRFRVATSLLYGETDEERWAALESEDPLAIPWIADSLSRLRSALAELRQEAGS
ncbi:pyridoxal phosphate-dependent aminotransferase [Flindersiella endophytica]